MENKSTIDELNEARQALSALQKKYNARENELQELKAKRKVLEEENAYLDKRLADGEKQLAYLKALAASRNLNTTVVR